MKRHLLTEEDIINRALRRKERFRMFWWLIVLLGFLLLGVFWNQLKEEHGGQNPYFVGE